MEQYLRSLAALAVASALLFGCDRGKSPDQVAQDVANAQDKASTEVAKAQDSAGKDVAAAAEKVGDKLNDLNNDAATDAYKIALAKADGDRKVALAQCAAQSGDAQKSCKNQADADYEAVKANAKAAEVSQKQ